MSRATMLPLLGLSVVGLSCIIALVYSPAPIRTKPTAPGSSSIDSVGERKPAQQESVSHPDTLILPGGVVVQLEPIRSETFKAAAKSMPRKLAGYAAMDSLPALQLETRRMQSAAGKVTRRGDTLQFMPANGQLVRLVNNLHTEEPEQYFFMSRLAPTRQWLVEKWLYMETTTYLLVDDQTGEQRELIDYPVISPHQRLMACGKSDFRGIEQTGLELWQLLPGAPPKRLWVRQPEQQVTDLAWADDHTLLLEQDWIDTSRTDGSMATRYVRLRLPEGKN